MRSYPGALCEFVKRISLHTSAGVNSLGGSDSCPGELRYSSISESKIGLFDGSGVKTCARCSAKVFAFSSFDRAHDLSRFLMGGIGVIGLLIFLVAFQMEWSSGDRLET